MIHVQIACEVTPQGVQGVRWVLVEPAVALPDVPTAAAMPPAPAEPPPATAHPVADGLRLGVLKALAVALGLGAALWTAAVQIGMPGAVGRAPVPAPLVPAAPSATPAAMPNPAAPHPANAAPLVVPPVPAVPADRPAPAASDGPSRLTASLS